MPDVEGHPLVRWEDAESIEIYCLACGMVHRYRRTGPCQLSREQLVPGDGTSHEIEFPGRLFTANTTIHDIGGR